MTRELRNLEQHVSSLTDELWHEGEVWYSNTRRYVKESLAFFCHDDVKDLKRGCQVFAALSPRVTFSRNNFLLSGFLYVAAAKREAGKPVTLAALQAEGIRGLQQSLNSACDAWNDGVLLAGPKVSAFATAVHSGGCADSEPVLDVWAMRACGVEWPPNHGARARCADAYRTFAEALDVTVHHLQAAVWVGIRGAAL